MKCKSRSKNDFSFVEVKVASFSLKFDLQKELVPSLLNVKLLLVKLTLIELKQFNATSSSCLQSVNKTTTSAKCTGEPSFSIRTISYNFQVPSNLEVDGAASLLAKEDNTNKQTNRVIFFII